MAFFTLFFIFLENENFVLPHFLQGVINKAIHEDKHVISFTTEFCQQLRTAFCCIIKYIAMKDPGKLAVNFNDQFIGQLKITNINTAVPSKNSS